MSVFTDLIKLTHKTGKIPASIPDHYVRWAMYTHRNEKKTKKVKQIAPKMTPENTPFFVSINSKDK